MKKRMTAAFTAAAMILAALPYSAAETIVNAVSSDIVIRSATNYTAGGIAVDIDILKNTGYISGSVDVNWDKTALTLVKVDFNTEVAKDNDSVPVPENGDTDGNYRLSLGDFLAEVNNTATGRAATLYFEKNSQDDDGTGYNIDLNNSDFVDSSVSQLVVDEIDCTVHELDAGRMYISGGTAYGYTGASNIRVPVNMVNSPGYISGTFDIEWDKNDLTLTGIEYNDDIAPALNAVPIPGTGVTTGRYKVSFGDLLAEENNSSAGNMMTLVFKASCDAEGTCPINFSNADIVNYDVQQVECKFSQAQVIVGKSGAFYDEETGIVTIYGRLTSEEEIQQYGVLWEGGPVRKIVAAEGASLPDDCSYLFEGVFAEEVDLTKADLSNVTDMSYMFNNSHIRRIDISNPTTTAVENMNYMFNKCQELTDVALDGMDTSNVTAMRSMFCDCPGLVSLDLSSFDTGKVGNMIRMFRNCTSLKKIYVSEKWTTENVTNAVQMFSNCTSIVGQNGTKYDMKKLSADYARIDRSGSMGYLSSAVPEFVTNSMTLGGSIALNFYLVPGTVPIEELEKSEVTFTVNGKTATAKFSKDKMNSRKTAYGFTCPLSSISMADDVTAVLRYTDADGEERTVTTVSNAESYMNKFSAAYGEVTWDLIRSINDFGYYMQRYLCDHSAEPWTLGVDHKAMEKAYTTHEQYTDNKSTYLDEMKDMQKVWGTNNDIERVYYSLVLESDTSLNFKIKKKDGYTGKIRVLLDGRLVSPTRLSDGRLQVTAAGIPAHLLGMPHTITVTTSSGTATYMASVLSYDYECMDKTRTDSEFDAMCALYEYYKATIAYRNSLQ